VSHPSPSRRGPTIEILGVPFARVDMASALGYLEELYRRDEPGFVAHANVHTVNLATDDPSYREVLRSADIVLNDGKGVMLGARLLGTRFFEDLNGNVVTPQVVALAEREGWPTYLLGAKPGVAERLREVLLVTHPSLQIVGLHHGHFGAAEDEVVRDIRASGTGLLLVGMGNPHQERFLHRRLRDTGARLGIGVGAYFDFQTGNVPRAPQWMSDHGLEWVFRLGREPKRMWKRYLVGNPRFLMRVLRRRARR